MIDALLKGIHNSSQFKKLLEIFYTDRNFYEVADSVMMIYCVLKNEEAIIKALNFEDLIECLKLRAFLTKIEERILHEKGKKVEDIIEMLKDKDLESFKKFFSSLRELKQDGVITLDDSYPSYSLYNLQCSLQKQYANLSFMKTRGVNFNLPISDDINIALIEISEDDHRKESTFYDYYSLLLKQETSYTRTFLNSYSDIVVENFRVILMQGYPGSGKTFLTKRMCTKWSKGELLQTFSCVIFLQLRDKEVANAKSLKQLVELHIEALAEVTVDEILKRCGKGLLIILEGWDELPETRQQSSLFTRLISGVLLPEAVILITSRPSAIRSLEYEHIERRIEILGFTEKQVMQNISYYFQKYHNCSELVEKFCSELERLPLLKCFVFAPINLSISLYIFNENDFKLPNTFTGMYKNLVLIQLQRYQMRTLYGCTSINSLENLPPEIDNVLLKLSKMAFEQLQNNITLIFDEAKIMEYCFDSNYVNLDNFDGMGLLQVTNHKHVYTIKTYEFIHRTLQELLAAMYLSRQDKSFQKKHLQNIFNKKEFEMVWIFYAGLTKFSSVSFKEFLPQNYTFRIKMLSFSAFIWLLKNIFSNIAFNKFPEIGKPYKDFYLGKQYSCWLSHYISTEFQTTLIAAVMEAQTPQLCKEMCESYLFHDDPCWFSVPESASTPQILSALSYCIAHSGKKWMIQCKIFDENMADSFLKYLTKSHFADRICLFDVDCSQNRICGIPTLLCSQKSLQWLILSYSKQTDDKMIAKVSKALEHNTSLIMLHLVGCNVTSKGIEALANMLKKNTTLKWIGLKDNMATLKESDIATLLQTIQNHNDRISMIFLDNILYSPQKIQELLKNINVARKLAGKQELELSLFGCLNFKDHEGCQRFISSLPFIRKKEVSYIITIPVSVSHSKIYHLKS